MSNYSEQIKKLFTNASPEAKKIINVTLEIEKTKRWQHQHPGMNEKISTDITSKVKDIVK